jgi:hypothetical protein
MSLNVNSGTKPVITMTDLNTPLHDYVSCIYTGANLTQLVYKEGGASGTTVATITLAYDGSNRVTSITKV